MRGSPIKNANPSLLRYVFEDAVPSVPVQAIWQTCRLADVKIIETVAVEIAGRHPVIAIDINPSRSIQHRTPVIRTVRELRFVGRDCREGFRSDVDECRILHRANRFGIEMPQLSLPVIGAVAEPLHLAGSDALF